MGFIEQWMKTAASWAAPLLQAPGYGLKHWLWPHQVPRPQEEEDVWNLTGQAEVKRPAAHQCLLLASLLMVVLALMALLFLWNYQCIMVWHLCLEEEGPSTLPGFGESESQEHSGEDQG